MIPRRILKKSKAVLRWRRRQKRAHRRDREAYLRVIHLENLLQRAESPMVRAHLRRRLRVAREYAKAQPIPKKKEQPERWKLFQRIVGRLTAEKVDQLQNQGPNRAQRRKALQVLKS